jgi:hypothetical protein
VPNVIAIVDDKKIRGQIENFCREINADGIRVRSFASAQEFEEKYFANKNAPKIHPLNKVPGWEKFSFDQIESVLNLPLVIKPALPAATVKVRISNKTMKIETIEPGLDANQTFLGRFPEDAKGQADFLGSCVFPAFRDGWSEFYRKSQAASAKGLFPLKASDTALGWFKVTGQRIDAENLSIELSEVTDAFRDSVKAELERRETHDQETEELQLLSEIDLVIFKIDNLGNVKVPVWMDRIWKKLKDGGYFPPDKITRFVLLKYEDDQVSKLDVLHPRIDDLIYLPLDRLIFLQKLEIIFGFPKKVTPSFLFSQDVRTDIEISKISKLERLSDLGLAIRNPVRLTAGLLAHFYVQFPGQDAGTDVWGKVIRSEPHPERAGEFLVYFNYFGLNRKEASLIKRHLTSAARYQPFIEAERSEFEFNPDDIFLADEDRRPKQVVVLDLDDAYAHQLKSSLAKDVDHIRIVADSSVAAFSNRFMKKSSTQFAQAPAAAGETELFMPVVTFVVTPENQEMSSALMAPAEDQTYLGYPAVETFSTALGWRQPFDAIPESKEVISEMMALAGGGRKVQRVLVGATSTGEGRFIRMALSPSDAPGLVKVEISPPSPEDLKAQGKEEKLAGLHLIIVDVNLIPGRNVDAFIENMTERGEALGLLPKGQKPKFILLFDTEAGFDHRKYAHASIVGMFAKPVEARPLGFTVATALDSRHSIYTFTNLGWANQLLPVHVAKDVILERLSEFGADIKHSRPIAPGSILFLRGGIFENAPNRCLAGRFYHCEEHPKEKGMYLCSLTYFGINDGFMKYARKWFRENYALMKQGESKD